ncbi:MAG: hypothetical protein WAL42_04250 [Nitrososphaeraceae archaeon]
MDYNPSSISGDDMAFMVRLINSGSSPKISSYFRFRSQSAASKYEQSTARRLQEIMLIQSIEGKFLSGSTNYRLTEKGIFYALSKLEEYPPALLIRYSECTVLQTLLYQFFGVQTIKRCTASLYAEITRYLKACSTRTISSLELFKNSRSEDQLNEHIRELELDLMWLAKILVLKLAMMYSEANILRSTSGMTKDNAKVALYELENDMKILLAKDSRFKAFLNLTYGELVEGYEEIRKRSENG